MKIAAWLVLLASSLVLAPALAYGATWYVRADGAPLYRGNSPGFSDRGYQPGFSCDGKHDAPFPAIGTMNVLGAVSNGTNQPCGVIEWKWLYDDQTTYNHLGWAIAGGDTVILDTGHAWNVGWENPQNSGPWCFGLDAGPRGCLNPPIPAGTAEQHTRILGRNWAACSKGGDLNRYATEDQSKMSELRGRFTVQAVLNLDDTSYVDVQCINIHSAMANITTGLPCGVIGAPYPSGGPCRNDYSAGPMDDYSGHGIFHNQGTHHVYLRDLWIHNLADSGERGPIGGAIDIERVRYSANGRAGLNFDDGASENGVSKPTPNTTNAALRMVNTLTEFSGCTEEANGLPGPGTCHDQPTAGYGDGFGTPHITPENGGEYFSVYMTHNVWRYNTSDGPDLTTINNYTGTSTLTFAYNYSYGNEGAALKFGNFQTINVHDNLLIANCTRMSAALPGITNAGYNSGLSDWCRAFNASGYGTENGASVTMTHNDVIGVSPTLLNPQCGQNPCTSTLTLTDNIYRAYHDPIEDNRGGNGGPGWICGYECGDNSAGRIAVVTRSGNVLWGSKTQDQVNVPFLGVSSTAVNEQSADPLFVGEPQTTNTAYLQSQLDNFNPVLTSGSPATGKGVDLTQFYIAQSADNDQTPPASTAPTVTMQPQAVTVTAGQTFAFTAAVSGTAPITCQWYEQNVAISGATSCTGYTGTGLIAQTGHLFKMVATNGTAPDATSNAPALTVTSAPQGPTPRVSGNIKVYGNSVVN